MPRIPKKRQCPRCGLWWDGKYRACPNDGASLIKKRFSMTIKRIRFIHTLALRQKGLSYEDYHARLLAVTGKSSCKEKGFNRRHYYAFIQDLKRLPDVPGRAP